MHQAPMVLVDSVMNKTNSSQKGEAKDKEHYNTMADNNQRQENKNDLIDKRTMLQGSEVIKN